MKVRKRGLQKNDNKQRMSLDAIAKELGISRERVRQIEIQALGKLKERARHLKTFLES